MASTQFEKIRGYQFKEGDEVYYIDKNRIDIFQATIKEITEKGILVVLDDLNSKTKKASPKRLLLRTAKNNTIYEKQEAERKKEKSKKKKTARTKNPKKNIDKDDNDSNDDNDNENENDNPKHKKRERKLKKPIFDKQLIVKTAWQKGIHNPQQFKKFIKKNMSSVYDEYERYFKMMNLSENPIFSFGGDLTDSEVKKFWNVSKVQWQKMFGDSDVVDVSEFVRKTANLCKLPKQTESNAKETLQFFFSPDEIENVSFSQFCAFLALFGPSDSVFRKIRDIFGLSEDIKNCFEYPEPAEFTDESIETEMNGFSVFVGTESERYVFNNPCVPYGKTYLIDETGKMFDTWNDFFTENPLSANQSKITKNKKTTKKVNEKASQKETKKSNKTKDKDSSHENPKEKEEEESKNSSDNKENDEELNKAEINEKEKEKEEIDSDASLSAPDSMEEEGEENIEAKENEVKQSIEQIIQENEDTQVEDTQNTDQIEEIQIPQGDKPDNASSLE
ncbi:hypothetical protein TRFO_09523 [Tritrichomonas foetus]|uniref:Initiator binding protein 39kDa C-terminal domain-containing protein n=1 Tax=Tritrichomonas foetus TaxID=1144522 RepID=A0A1J4JJ54_9EUKA|nr:hypothetical protein TRFO_09523 [Tritrichomonas foetus]|eukprot:OHS97260.1 hypothetical protein TRFO_09523 [Tritrichomonas foetus]